MLNSKLGLLIKFTFLGTLGLAIGGASVFFYKKQSGVQRSVASIGSYKPHGLIIGKQAAAMSVQIAGPDTYPDNNDETVELIGYITQHLTADSSLSYEWTLPEGVELQQGPLSDTLTNLRLGRPQQVRLLVRGFSRNKKKLISLKTQVFAGHAPLTASAAIVSRPEDTTEAKVMELQAQAKAAAEY